MLDIEIPYGGGTVMNSAGRYCEENGIEADIHLCFTDGCMYEEDYKRCERYGMVLVFDSKYNHTYADGMISRSGIRAICADDSVMAA